MSFYATLQGYLTYRDKKAFEDARNVLFTGGWIDSDGYLLDERGHRMHPEEIQVSANKISIPMDLYRNLTRVLRDIYPGSNGRLVMTSTDGVFEGRVTDIINGSPSHSDEGNLWEWAVKNGWDKAEIPDVDKDFDHYCETMTEVELQFHEFHW